MREKLYIGLLLPVMLYADDTLVPQHLPDEATHHTEPVHAEPVVDESDGDDFDEDADESSDAEDADGDEFELPEYARGNWYKKQGILKESHDVYQKVRHEEQAVAQFEKIFIDKKNGLTNRLEAFSQALGIPLLTVYTLVSDELEALERTQVVQDSPEERIKAAQKQEIKNLLIQLKKDIDVVNDLYKALDQAMAVLMQQITASHNFEQKAFDSYEKITHVLSDQVAKQLYAEIVAARENISTIGDYIKGDFSHYFEELSHSCGKSLELIQQQLDSLKEHGVDMVTLHAESRKELHESEEKAVVPDTPQPEKRWYDSVMNMVVQVGAFFTSIMTWFKGFFV